MATYASPFFTTPGVAQSFGTLAQAFMPDPQREAVQAARVAQARLAGAQAGEIENRVGMARSAGERLRAANGADPAALAQVFADVLAGANPAMLQQLPGFIRGFGGAVGADPERLAQLFVGAGGNYAHTEPGFMRADATDRRGQDVAAGATLGAARIGADGRIRQTQIEEEGRDRRFAVTARPGEIVTLPEGSPVAPAGQRGPVTLRGDERPQTYDQFRAGQGAAWVEAAPTPEVRAQRQEAIVAPSVAAATVRNAGRVEQIQLQGAQAMELQNLRGAQAAGRLDTQGQQRLQQLELQNAGALERAQAGAAARPAPTVPAALARQIEAAFGQQGGFTFTDNTRRTLDAASQRWLRQRAGELWQSGPEGVRGNVEAAINEAFAEYEAQGPVFSGSAIFGRSAALPPSLARTPPQQGGYRLPNGQVIPEGATIRQGGQLFRIQNGQPVPAS